MKYLALMVFIATLGLTACEKGPAEDLGEKIDDAATDVGNAVEDICDDVTNRNCG